MSQSARKSKLPVSGCWLNGQRAQRGGEKQQAKGSSLPIDLRAKRCAVLQGVNLRESGSRGTETKRKRRERRPLAGSGEVPRL